MKFCRQCGNEIMDESVICPKCGCATGVAGSPVTNASTTSGNSGLITAAKILMIVGTIITGCTGFLIPLAWCIPMTVIYWGKVKRGEPVSVAFKVCSLLFVSMLGGIFMLVSNETAARPATIPADAVPAYASDDEEMSYAVAPKNTKAFSIVSMVTGIVSVAIGGFIGCCCSAGLGAIIAIPCGIAAVVFAIVSRVKNGRFSAMDIVGLSLGSFGILSAIIVLILSFVSSSLITSFYAKMFEASNSSYYYY